MLTEEQARAILDLRLMKLTALGLDEIMEDARKLAEQITDLLDILRSRDRVVSIIKEELSEIKEKYATPRRSEFAEGGMFLSQRHIRLCFSSRQTVCVISSRSGSCHWAGQPHAARRS